MVTVIITNTLNLNLFNVSHRFLNEVRECAAKVRHVLDLKYFDRRLFRCRLKHVLKAETVTEEEEY